MTLGLRILVIGGTAQDLQEIQSFAEAEDQFMQISVGSDLHLVLSKSWDGVILRCISMGSEEKRDEVKALLQASFIPAAVWAENFIEERAALWFNAGAERLFTKQTIELQLRGFFNSLRKRKSYRMESQEEIPVTPLAEALLDTMPTVVLAADIDGRIIYMNRACEEVTGCRLEEVYHSSFMGFVHPDDREESALIFQRLNKDQPIPDFVNRWVSKSGEIHWLDWTCTNLRNNRGQISIIVGTATDITEQQEKTLALIESEALFHSVFDNSPVALCIIDSKTYKFLMLNPASENLLELPKEKMIGYTIDELGLPLLVKSGFDVLSEADQAGRLINQEYQLRTGNGEIRTLLFSFDKVTMKGEPCILSSAVDITDRKRAENAIRQLNEQLEDRVKRRTASLQDEISRRRQIEEEQKQLIDLLEETPDVVAFCDLNGILKFINRAGWELFGENRSRINRTNVQTWFPEGLMDQFWDTVFPIVKETGAYRGETLVIDREGNPIPLSLVILSHKGEDGSILYISTIARDISETRHTLRLLEESEQKFRSLAEAAKDFIYIIDRDGVVQYVNSVAAHAQFKSPEQLTGQPVTQIFPITDSLNILDQVQNIFQSGRPLYLENQVEFPAYGQLWIGSWLVPMMDDQEQVYLVTGLSRDITQSKNAQTELERSFQQERELNELRSNFISMASHEFRTPISVILSSAELLKYYGEKWPSAKRQEHYQRINDASQRLNGILQDLLTVGRAQSNQEAFVPVAIHLADFCRTLVGDLSQTDPAGHVVNLEIAKEDSQAFLDPRMVRQILENLLGNAVKFSPPGSTIDFQVRKENDQVYFRITDHGRGIPEKDQKHLFQAFYRGSNIGSIPGTGLGLPIVKFYVDRMGGRLEYHSQEGIGTTFEVILPDQGAETEKGIISPEVNGD